MEHLKCRAVFIFLVHGLDVPILSALKLFNETFPRKMKTKKKFFLFITLETKFAKLRWLTWKQGGLLRSFTFCIFLKNNKFKWWFYVITRLPRFRRTHSHTIYVFVKSQWEVQLSQARVFPMPKPDHAFFFYFALLPFQTFETF